MSACRTVSLHNITLPVRVSHGNLAPDQRIDDLSNRIDTLKIGLSVQYESRGDAKPHSMDGVWNYGDVYHHLCLSDVQTITGPLEGVLDEALALVDATAKAQNLVLNDVQVSADRMGLAVGYPRLIARKRYSASRGEAPEMERSAGICNFPLVISVSHAWCEGSQRVEHVDVRTESVSLSFRAETRANSLSSSDLAGLYNYAGLIHQVQKMLCIGLIHGDLSEYNVLVAPDGPVLIDFPQVVSAAGNNAARTMLLRDVNNLTASLGRFAPELLDTWYGEEMWALFEAGELHPDTVLSGEFTPDESSVDLDSVRHAINDAREEALIRQQGREAAAEDRA